MAEKKITDLNTIDAVATGDLVEVVDISDTIHSAEGSSKKSTFTLIASFLASLAQTLTNKTINFANNTLTGVASTTTEQTLTNKTLTSPVINTGVSGTAIDTDGTLATNSDAVIASQKATKTYVDARGKTSLSQQVIINGNFVVNQRVYVSDAVLAAGSYGHDRWKAGASGGDYTFTQLASSTTITIKSEKSLIQVIEDKNVVGGTYTLSWTGTAQARFGKDSATPSGSYAASPITLEGQAAGTVMSVEFNEGTLGKVQLNSGSTALSFQAKSYSEELKDCTRYYQRLNNNTAGVLFMGVGSANSTTSVIVVVPFPNPMRISPTTTVSAGFTLSDGVGSPLSGTLSSASAGSFGQAFFTFTVAGATQYRLYFLRSPNSSSYVELSAEL